MGTCACRGVCGKEVREVKQDCYRLLDEIEEVEKKKLFDYVKDHCYHGAEPTFDDLESILQALHTGETFIETIISITAQHNPLQDDSLSSKFEDEDYKMIYSTHSRNDRDGNLRCSYLEGKTVIAEFVGKMLVKNYSRVMDTLPNHVPVRSVKDVEEWARSIPLYCPHPDGNDRYTIGKQTFLSHMEGSFRAEFVQAVKSIDWDNAPFDVYATVPFDGKKDGDVFAPAFNCLWLIKSESSGEAEPLKLWFIISALADGTPSGGYFGLEFGKPIISRSLAKFSPLANQDNIYRVTVSEDPLTFKIEAFHYQTNREELRYPYIVVTSEFKHATMKEIAKIGHLDELDCLKKTVAILVKGALMEEILILYRKRHPRVIRLLEMVAGKQEVDSCILSLKDWFVGDLEAAFDNFAKNRGAIWVIRPEIVDTDPDASEEKRLESYRSEQSAICKLARTNLMKGINSI